MKKTSAYFILAFIFIFYGCSKSADSSSSTQPKDHVKTKSFIPGVGEVEFVQKYYSQGIDEGVFDAMQWLKNAGRFVHVPNFQTPEYDPERVMVIRDFKNGNEAVFLNMYQSVGGDPNCVNLSNIESKYNDYKSLVSEYQLTYGVVAPPTGNGLLSIWTYYKEANMGYYWLQDYKTYMETFKARDDERNAEYYDAKILGAQLLIAFSPYTANYFVHPLTGVRISYP